MLAGARVDYSQDDSRKTRIPKPTTTAVKKAYSRRTSNILRMMGIGENEASEYKETDAADASDESEDADIISFVAKRNSVLKTSTPTCTSRSSTLTNHGT